MPLSHLEHYLIVARSYEETCRWYVSNLGMTVGAHPDFGPDVEVTWLYIGEHDVIHIVPPREPETDDNSAVSFSKEDIAKGGRPIHHIAFRASGRKSMLEQFKQNHTPYIEQQGKNATLVQVFVRDPNGITVELNFPADELEEGETLPVLSLKPN